MGRTEQPLAQPDGQESRRRQMLVPVSKAVTGATFALGAPSYLHDTHHAGNPACSLNPIPGIR